MPIQTLLFIRAGRLCLDRLATTGRLGQAEERVAFKVTEQEEEDAGAQRSSSWLWSVLLGEGFWFWF